MIVFWFLYIFPLALTCFELVYLWIYGQLTKVTDTTAAQARKGKDIQGIPWDRLNITREKYRLTRLEQYRNYENVPSSGESMDKVCYLSWSPFFLLCLVLKVVMQYYDNCICWVRNASQRRRVGTILIFSTTQDQLSLRSFIFRSVNFSTAVLRSFVLFALKVSFL